MIVFFNLVKHTNIKFLKWNSEDFKSLPIFYLASVVVEEWNSAFFAFSLIIEGTKEKVLQLIMPLKSIYSQNLGFVEQKMHFWTLQTGSNNKKSTNWHYYCHENIFLMSFPELPPIGFCCYYLKMCCSIGITVIFDHTKVAKHIKVSVL